MRVMRGERPSRPSPMDECALEPTDDAWDLISRCWAHDSDVRPEMAEVCSLLAGAYAAPTSLGVSLPASEPFIGEPVQHYAARASINLRTSLSATVSERQSCVGRLRCNG
jgi:hypothetical protein